MSQHLATSWCFLQNLSDWPKRVDVRRDMALRHKAHMGPFLLKSKTFLTAVLDEQFGWDEWRPSLNPANNSCLFVFSVYFYFCRLCHICQEQARGTSVGCAQKNVHILGRTVREAVNYPANVSSLWSHSLSSNAPLTPNTKIVLAVASSH